MKTTVKNYHVYARNKPIHADFEITIDVDALLKAIGGRAAENKSGRTRLQSGAVLITVTNIRGAA